MDPTMSNERRHMRTPITLKIKFKSGSLDQFIERYSVDVSRSGIFIRTKEPLAVGTQLKFEFQLQDTSPLIGGEGTVVWTREHDPGRTGVAPGMGVRFDKLTGQSQQTLDQILSEKTKRGEATVESRFDAGVRASQTSSGERDSNTPLPSPLPGLADADGFGANESTRVMQADQSRQLADSIKEPDQRDSTVVMAAPTVEALAAQTARGGPEFGHEERTSVMSAPTAEALAAATTAADPAAAASQVQVARSEPATPTPPTPPPKPAPKIEVVEAPRAAEPPRVSEPPRLSEPPRASTPPAKKSSNAVTIVLALLLVGGGIGVWAATRGGGDDAKKGASNPPAPAAGPVAIAPPPAAAGAPAAVVQPTALPSPAAVPAAVLAAPPTPAPAPAPAPAAAKPAGLEIEVASTPPGATVTIDGKPVDGVTPTKVAGLEAKKSYEIAFSLKGFKPFKQKVQAAAGKPWSARLSETEKVLEVSSIPDGADILLDGKKVGKTGKSPVKVKVPGLAKDHELQIKRTGYVKDERKVTAADPFESKGDKDVLTVAVNLVPEDKPAAPAPVAAAATPKAAPTKKAAAAPAEKPEKVAAKSEEPAPKPEKVEEKPKPVEKVEEKPKAVEKVEEKPKPEKVEEKPKAAEKPAEGAPAGQPIKVPSWMKAKPAAAPDTPPAQ
jgi:uncharacterized protein (TIGR02266 family)